MVKLIELKKRLSVNTEKLRKTDSYGFSIYWVLLLFQIICYVINMYYKVNLFIVSALLLTFSTLTSIFLYGLFDTKKNFIIRIFYCFVSAPLSISMLFNSLYFFISFDLLKIGEYKLLIPSVLVLNIIIFFLCFPFYRSTVIHKLFIDINNSNKDDNSLKPGDAILGIDVDTGNDVIIPFNDRFLHLLCLGPTGSGKTSMTIIPMINRDIQNRDLGIIVIEPKGDLAEKIYQMGLYYGREDSIYFNPTLKNCPYFNPLFGSETDVIENISTTFRMLDPDSSTFFQNQAENLTRKAVKMLKRLYGNDATLVQLDNLIWNTGGFGRMCAMQLSSIIAPNESIDNENHEIAQWFIQDYLAGASGEKGAPKTYEHCSGIRTQISKLVSNIYLRKILNPPPGHGSDIRFDDALANRKVITISTAQGELGALGDYLGYFLIFQLQSAVFRRPAPEASRPPCMLYIDEFQVYSNPGFANMLTQGRSYRVASHLATQNLDLIAMGGGSKGKDFAELVKTNARNLVVYPGGNAKDAKYFSELFGEDIVEVLKKSQSQHQYNPILGWGLKAPNINISYVQEKKARLTTTDIMYMDFSYICYRIVRNKSVTRPGKSKIQFIPKELNDLLDEKVLEFNALNINKIDDDFYNKLAEEKRMEKEKSLSSPMSTQEYIVQDVTHDSSLDDIISENTSHKNNSTLIEDISISDINKTPINLDSESDIIDEL